MTLTARQQFTSARDRLAARIRNVSWDGLGTRKTHPNLVGNAGSWGGSDYALFAPVLFRIAPATLTLCVYSHPRLF